MNKILKKWNTENANKIDSITGIQGYFHKNWNTLYSTIILSHSNNSLPVSGYLITNSIDILNLFINNNG